MKLFSILVLAFAAVLLAAGSPRAQINSSALDPHCYQPQIGTPDVDTICGDTAYQGFGADLINIGAPPYSPYGSIIFSTWTYGAPGIDPVRHHASLDSPPPIDLHNASYGKRLNFELPGPIVHVGPIHTSTSRDIVAAGDSYVRIYWEADDGTYSADSYSELVWDSLRSNYFPEGPIIGKIVSDSVEDILASIGYGDNNGDSVSFLLYRGGTHLYGSHRLVSADSFNLVDTGNVGRFYIQGNFTNSLSMFSRDDWGNLFLTPIPKPFSFDEFRKGYQNDTLLSQLKNPRILRVNGSLNIRAFPKLPDDSSDDLIVAATLDQNTQSDDYLLFFKGGPDFGTHQITIDSAQFQIRSPHASDALFNYSGTFGSYLHNCGDLTHTGNDVLAAVANDDAIDYWFFYVLGTQLDNKADLFLEPLPAGWLTVDTITADLSGYEDLIFSNPDWNTDSEATKGKYAFGSVMIVHGLNKIPLHPSSVASEEPLPSGTITFSPNPCQGKGTLTFSESSSDEVEIDVLDVMGRTVRSVREEVQIGTTELPVVLSDFADGVYIIRVSGPSSQENVRVVKVP